ncbi:MAG: hypothetical protein US74_C0006G0046 [Parcubacteria group bacterium GW2011_GWA2_38_13]|nr:MAG: hypothetical protein US74_C0006G0046 [Parcubacteria group bacterium GW2011_GWA2_38_13]
MGRKGFEPLTVCLRVRQLADQPTDLFYTEKYNLDMGRKGFEPLTVCLRGNCSTN